MISKVIAIANTASEKKIRRSSGCTGEYWWPCASAGGELRLAITAPSSGRSLATERRLSIGRLFQALNKEVEYGRMKRLFKAQATDESVDPADLGVEHLEAIELQEQDLTNTWAFDKLDLAALRR